MSVFRINGAKTRAESSNKHTMKLPSCFAFLAFYALATAEDLRADAQGECVDGKCGPVISTIYCTETTTMTTTMCQTVYVTSVKMMTSILLSCPTPTPACPAPPPPEKSGCGSGGDQDGDDGGDQDDGTDKQDGDTGNPGCPSDQNKSRTSEGQYGGDMGSGNDDGMGNDMGQGAPVTAQQPCSSTPTDGTYGQQGGAEDVDEDADLRVNEQFLPGCRRRCLWWGPGGFCRRWSRRCRCAEWGGGGCRRWSPWFRGGW